MDETIYKENQLPKGTSWVKALNAEMARKQCLALGLDEPNTLVEARSALVAFVKSRSGGVSPQLALPTEPQLFPPPVIKVGDSEAAASTPKDVEAEVAQAIAEPLFSQTLSPPDVASLVQATATAVGIQLAGVLAGNQPQPASCSTVPDSVAKELYKAIPPASGAHPEQLVIFLSQAQKLISVGLIDERSVMLNLLPKTTDQLRVKWLQALTDFTGFDTFKRHLVNTLIPQRVQHTLLTSMVYRAQRPGESVSHFVDDLVQVAALLSPDMAASETLEVVLTGLNPSTRANLAGLPPPASLEELLALEPRLLAIANTHCHDRTNLHQTDRVATDGRGSSQNFTHGRVAGNFSRPATQGGMRHALPFEGRAFASQSSNPVYRDFRSQGRGPFDGWSRDRPNQSLYRSDGPRNRGHPQLNGSGRGK